MIKTCFLLALTSAKRISKLHILLFEVGPSRHWWTCTFSFIPGFVAKTQNPSLPDSHFDGFSILFLCSFVDGDRDEMLHCLVRALKEYLAPILAYRLACLDLFAPSGRCKKPSH